LDLKSEKAQLYLMFRYQILIEYVGTNFRGWQIQTKGKTIQGFIQERISKLLKEKIVLFGAGRLDKGVHALEQSAHFECKKKIENLLIGLLLIIKNKTLDESFFVIFLFLTVLVIFYLVELFLFRWYQLTDNEKKKLTTFLEFKNNFSKILESINLVFGDFMKPSNLFNFGRNNKNITQKKWVRKDKNDNIKV